MNNTLIFCLTLNPKHEDLIKELSYLPVGLGNEKFSKDCLNDKNGLNISKKNSFYGEYTFHFWLWKNYLNKINSKWIGFCQYRKFFIKEKIKDNNINFKELKNLTVRDLDNYYEKFDCILGNKFSVENYKLSKIVKHHFFDFLKKPKTFINKKKRNLKFHFDIFHGKGNLELAIDLLDENNKNDFRDYMNNNTSFHPHNMLICKTKILKNYYEVVFPWLKKCEDIFGFDDLNSYGQKRIYGFLAERFLSFWFSKNYKIKELTIYGKDLSDYKNL